MHRDRNGLELTATESSVVEALDESVDRLLHFEFGMADPLKAVHDESGDFPLAEVFHAYLGGLSLEAALITKATERFGAFCRDGAEARYTARERGHIRAATLLLAGRLAAAARVLAEISGAYPLDTIALAVGHQVDLMLGDTRLLRDRIGAALQEWDQARPGYPVILGMYAFGLEENGAWESAEILGVKAVELDQANVWAIHAVAHVCEAGRRSEQGVQWLAENRRSWDAENQLRSHLAWHECLYLLDSGDTSRVLAIYDDAMAPEKVGAAAIKLHNGSSMLWRLHLRGVDVGDRFVPLAQQWEQLSAEAWSAFNDLHAVMCYLGADDVEAAKRLIADRSRYSQHALAGSDNVEVTAAIGIPVCQALVDFHCGKYAAATETLLPLRHDLYRCGGSHAQRDVIDQTLIESAMRAHRQDDARSVMADRNGYRVDWRRQSLRLPLLAE